MREFYNYLLDDGDQSSKQPTMLYQLHQCSQALQTTITATTSKTQPTHVNPLRPHKQISDPSLHRTQHQKIGSYIGAVIGGCVGIAIFVTLVQLQVLNVVFTLAILFNPWLLGLVCSCAFLGSALGILAAGHRSGVKIRS